jgi:hypothetical protein
LRGKATDEELSKDEAEAQSGGVATSVGGDVASGRGKRGNDVSWANVNLTRPKNEENLCDRFN